FKPTTLKRWQIFTLLGLFLILLFVARLWWADMFSNPKKAHVENGYIDLSDWDEDTEEMLSLNGDWDFYPNNFVIDDSDVKEKITTVPVPSGWNQDDFTTKEENENFGYGTYHLPIQVNTDNNQKYSIQFPSIRSSSTLYVNGELTEQIGIPASSKEKYKTQNRPFKSTLHPDENGVIDIKVQVANFDDIRKGGIIRTPKFGTKEVVNNYFDFSIFMQILVIILLILHSIYAIALFLLSHKNTKLLFTAGLFLSISVVIGLAFDEKVFTIFFTVNYLWGFKLVNIASVASSALLLLVTKYENVHFWNKLHYIYMSLIAITAITVLVADVSLITTITPLVSILAVIGIIIAFVALIKMMITQFNTIILLLFSIISVGSYVFWTIYWMNIGINVPYYPLEIIIVIMCVAILWFWYFFKVYQESQNLALELEEINESKDQFLANTAHEFKNPLHSILNITQSVLKKE